MGTKVTSEDIFDELFERYPCLWACEEQIRKTFDLLSDVFDNHGKLYIAGNGGSASDSEHIVGELMKPFKILRKVDEGFSNSLRKLFPGDGDIIADNLTGGLGAISLPSFVSLSSAIINDMDAAFVYAQPLSVLGLSGDAFLGISTSGNSLNVTYAAMTARAKGMYSIGLSGESTCKLDEICDVVIHAPARETYQVQELHLPIYHAICAMLEARYW